MLIYPFAKLIQKPGYSTYFNSNDFIGLNINCFIDRAKGSLAQQSDELIVFSIFCPFSQSAYLLLLLFITFIIHQITCIANYSLIFIERKCGIVEK
jgi:hypothetical protein